MRKKLDQKIALSIVYFLIIIFLEFLVPIAFRKVYMSIYDIRLRLALSHFLCFIVPAIIFMLITKSNPKKILRINKINLKQFLIVVLLAFACQPIMMACSGMSALFFQNNISNFVNGISDTPFLIMLLLIAAMPAISEEITIRGIVLSGFDKISDIKAAIITGIMFGIFHLDLQQFLYAAVLGIILGYVVRVTNSILSSMIMHFLINGTSVVMQKISTGALDEVERSSSSISLSSLPIEQKVYYFFIYLVFFILFGVIVVLILKALKSVSNNKTNISQHH